MKKVISVILAVLFSVSCFSVAVNAGKDELNLVVASDLHFSPAPKSIEFYDEDDELYGYAEGMLMSNESSFIIDAFLEECAANDDMDYLLISGDLTNDGNDYHRRYRTVANKLEKFERETGKDVFVIDGNHDINSDDDIPAFKSAFRNFGYDKALTVDENTCSYTADLGKKYRLIALDTCYKGYLSLGSVNADRFAWLIEQVEQANADGKYPVVMTHYNLLKHWTLHQIDEMNLMNGFDYTAARRLANLGVKMILTGHEHNCDVSTYETNSGNVITEFLTPSLTSYPLSYRTFSLTDETISYDTQSVKGIDTKKLSETVNGYNDAQLKFMDEDIVAYSKGYLEKFSVTHFSSYLRRFASIADGDMELRKVIADFMYGMDEIFQMPLYGEDSVEALAKQYGIDISESDYKTCWDIVANLIDAHFAGNGQYTINDDEFKIIYHSAALTKRIYVSPYGEQKLADAINKYLNKDVSANQIESIARTIFPEYTIGEYLVVSASMPLLQVYFNDKSEINNVKGSINGYAYENIDGGFNLNLFIAKIKTRFWEVVNNLIKLIKKF